MSTLKMINLGLHFFLELGALAALAYWGFHTGSGLGMKLLLGAGAPLLGAVLWGVFRVPNDPGPAVVAIAGPLRLALELGFFALSVAALYAAGQPTLALAFGLVILANYAVMFDHVLWLLNHR